MTRHFETEFERNERRMRNRPSLSEFQFHNLPIPTLSKNAVRRTLYIKQLRDKLGRSIPGRFHFDVGRFLDRSKYDGDGKRK